jgi:UDP-glucose 4-epimerase
VERGNRVTVADDVSNGDLENLRGIVTPIAFHELDIRTSDFRDFLLSGRFDATLHFAANEYVPPSVENPDYDFQLQLLAPFQMLEALHKAKLKVVYRFR